jgi:hypothetical protein
LIGKLRVTVWQKGRRAVMALIELSEEQGRRVLKVQPPELAFRSMNDPEAFVLELDYALLAHVVARSTSKARVALRLRLGQALMRYWSYADVTDWMYRQLSSRDRMNGLIRLGFRCNQRCSFCWQGRDWPDAPDAYYWKWLKEFAEAHVYALTVTGGEPSLHPLLLDLVQKATRVYHMAVWLQTNAVRLGRPEVLTPLIEAGLEGVHVSYHSVEASTSDQMTGSPGSHERTVEGVLACLRAGLGVSFNCVVERANAEGLEAHAADIVERFVRPFAPGQVRSVDYSFPSHYHSDQAWRAAVVPLDQIAGPLVAAVRRLKAAGVHAELFSDCGFPTCIARDAVDLIPSFESRALYGMDGEGRVWVEACERCALRSDCLGLRPEYVAVHGDRGVVPFGELPEGLLRLSGGSAASPSPGAVPVSAARADGEEV